MIDKKIITRKEHICGVCDKIINKGCIAIFVSIRIAKYNDDDKQIGINYIKYYICKNCSSN